MARRGGRHRLLWGRLGGCSRPHTKVPVALLIDGRRMRQERRPSETPGLSAQLPYWAAASVLGCVPGLVRRHSPCSGFFGCVVHYEVVRAHDMSGGEEQQESLDEVGEAELGGWLAQGTFLSQALPSVSLAQSRCLRSSELDWVGRVWCGQTIVGVDRIGSFTCHRGHHQYYLLPPLVSPSLANSMMVVGAFGGSKIAARTKILCRNRDEEICHATTSKQYRTSPGAYNCHRLTYIRYTHQTRPDCSTFVDVSSFPAERRQICNGTVASPAIFLSRHSTRTDSGSWPSHFGSGDVRWQ